MCLHAKCMIMVQPIGCTRTKQPACDLREIPIEIQGFKFHQMNDPIMVLNQKGVPIWNTQLCPIQKKFQIVSTHPIVSNRLNSITGRRSIMPNPPCRGQPILSWPMQLWRTYPIVANPSHAVQAAPSNRPTRPVVAHPLRCGQRPTVQW